ncbi:MAG: methyltransferase domain-containing protein [Actinobacteria bacterium]|nr:methyltransferase domain-containing protein [Actinomycetota bacterium]
MAATSSTAGGTDHWERRYRERRADELSWTEAAPTASLELIAAARLPRQAGILDAGGGAAGLAAALSQAGYTDLTVADISAAALARARAGLGERAAAIIWVEADLRDHDFGRRFELWHDRAAFHFMVTEADREGYLRTLERSLAPGGHLVLAGFGPAGPSECSGLPVARRDAEEIAALLGDGYALVSSHPHQHRTPSGAVQEFVYAHFQRRR